MEGERGLIYHLCGQGDRCRESGRSLTGQSPLLKRTTHSPACSVPTNVKQARSVSGNSVLNQKHFVWLLVLPLTKDTHAQLQFPSWQGMVLLSLIGIKIKQLMWQGLEASMPEPAYKGRSLPSPCSFSQFRLSKETATEFSQSHRPFWLLSLDVHSAHLVPSHAHGKW